MVGWGFVLLGAVAIVAVLDFLMKNPDKRLFFITIGQRNRFFFALFLSASFAIYLLVQILLKDSPDTTTPTFGPVAVIAVILSLYVYSVLLCAIFARVIPALKNLLFPSAPLSPAPPEAPPEPTPEPPKPIFSHKLRLEHFHIVAGSGHGKTQFLQSLILDDSAYGVSIVVIDSQSQMINELATRLPRDRVILIDPEHCAPPLNIFVTSATGQKQIATAVELYEYIFNALDASMTSKQSTAYRFLTRLLFVIPGANIHTLRELLEPGGLAKYQHHLEKMGDTARSFFANEYDTREFKDTRSQILRRLYTLLENEALETMLSADRMFDIGSAIAEGKIVLINTNKGFLKQGSGLFGRIFIAQVMQYVFSRNSGPQTHLYLDEFQDYAEDSQVLFDLFEQSRKFKLGITVAHQYLGQLPPKLRESIASNTSTKFAGGVSPEDASALARQFRTTPEFILEQPKMTFASWSKGTYASYHPVPAGLLESIHKHSTISAVREAMREMFNPLPHREDTPKRQKEADSGPHTKGKGSGEAVDEKGEW